MAEDISKKINKKEIKIEPVCVKNEGYNKVGLYTLIHVPEKYESNSKVNLQNNKNYFIGYNGLKV